MKLTSKYVRCLGAILLGSIMIFSGCGDDIGIGIEKVSPSKVESETGTTGESGPASSDEAEEKDPVSGKTQDEGKGETEGSSPQDQNSESREQQSQNVQSESSSSNEEEPESPQPVSITISAAGDVTMGNYIGQGYENSFRQTYEKQEDKSYFFKNVYDIFSRDDMTIVNLEGTLTFSEEPNPGRTYNIKGDPEYAYLLNDGSIEAVSMANNHRMDFGEEGAIDSVEAVKAAGVAYAYDNVLGTYEVNGIKIGWVSVNEIAYGTGIEKILEKGITKLKVQGANLILACCHWGIERENYPEDYQKEVGRKCIDWGADLVLGHHPHVLQGIEEYQGKYIVYSLANFCFGANRNPADKDTMIFQQTFTFEALAGDLTNREGAATQGTSQMSEGTTTKEKMVYGTAQPGEARMIPCSVSSVTHRNDYCPTPLTGEDGQRVIDRINEYSKDFGVTVDSDGVLSHTGRE